MDERHTVPWVFSREPGAGILDCTVNECIQRLWCTDSGVAGRYASNTRRHNVNLSFVWLESGGLQADTVLSVVGHEGLTQPETVLDTTSQCGPGTLIVLGDVLYFYSFSDEQGAMSPYYLPRLSAIQFDRYRAGARPDSLWRFVLRAANILGSVAEASWHYPFSPIYPAGRGSVTVSVKGGKSPTSFSVDSVLTVTSQLAVRRALVHTTTVETMSISSTSREFLSAVGYACRAFQADGAPLCYRTREGGVYTWTGATTVELRIVFSSFSRADLPSFRLPESLWLLDSKVVGRDTFHALATFGLGSIIAFNGSTFWGVETQANLSCPGGSHLALVRYRVEDSLVPDWTSGFLGCAQEQVFDPVSSAEVYGAAAVVKWAGPYQGSFFLFLARNINGHEYYGPFEFAFDCGPGRFIEAGQCVECPRGHACDGVHLRRCLPGSTAADGAFACLPCPPGFSSLAVADQCFLCSDGTVCSGGSAPSDCRLDLGQGAALCSPCGGYSAWHKGACVGCDSLSGDWACEQRVQQGLSFFVAVKTVPDALGAKFLLLYFVPAATVSAVVAAILLVQRHNHLHRRRAPDCNIIA